MKKRTLAIVAVLLVAAVMTGIFAACVTEFQLKFMVDGEVYAVVNTAGEETVKLPENPTKEGYIFDGWYWDDGIWAQPFTAESLLEQKLESDMAVYAKWLEEDITKRTFKVTFDSMSGSAVEPVTALYGTLVKKPSDPTRTGYVFVGWFKQADLSEEWDFSSDTLTENITLYAKWVSESDASGCDILTAEGFDFDAEGKTLSIKTPNLQEYFALSSALTVSPYASWTVTSDAEGREEVPSATVPLQVGDNTFYINITSGTQSNKNQYTVNIRRRAIYTVTYDFAGGGESASEQVEEDGLAPAKEGTRTGYTFSGWTVGETAWDFEESVVTGDITLTAVWTANSYSVTFDAAGGEETEGVEVTFGSAAQLPVPERSGYTFTGWQKEDGTAVSDAAGAVGEWNIAEDVSLTASWSVVTYDVTYNNVEGATHSNPATYTVEDAAVALQDAAKTGYTFLGWYSDAEFEQEVSEIDTSACEDVELWARWEVITYTATFVNSDGTVGTVDFDIEDTALSEPAVPQRTGYTGAWEDYEIKAEDLTINAVYTPITYDITYENTKGAANNNPATYNIETATITLSDITSPGHTFEGWFAGEEKVESIELGSYGDITLTAKWAVITYNITYENTKGAANGNPATYNIESAITLSDITSPGYTFEGWFAGEEKVESIELGSYGDITLTAVWTANTYSVTFDAAGGEETEGVEVTFGSAAQLPVPERSGYTFTGWQKEDGTAVSDAAGAVGEWNIAEDVSLTASWSVVTYDVTYNNVEGATHSNPATYTVEDAAVALQDAAKTGYTFLGWYSDAEFEQEVSEIDTSACEDVELWARWEVITYTATFVNSDGTVGTVDFDIEDTALSEPAVPQRTGYTGAWEAYEIKAEDLTINAVYTPITYNITYENTLGAVNTNPATYNIESAITLSDITSPGYTFEGWYTDETFEEQVDFISEGSFGDLELFAKWTPMEYSVNYVLDGGINAEANPFVYTVETLGGADGVIALEDPSKDKSVDIDHIINGEASVTYTTYSFGGWYKDSGFEQRVSELSLALGNVTLYAKWNESSETKTEQVYTRSGNYIYFGEYPQTIKAADVSIISNTPDADGYYLGSDGERYAKVVADPYPFNSGYTFSNNSSVIDGNTYYFKVEPIRWRILSESDGNAFILCDSIIANHYYHHTTSSTTIDGQTVYANNYKYSDIRAWLNDEFYNTAFGDLQQALIQTTEVDNSAQSTGNSSNRYACENTSDKVFLPSYREVTNSAYGFASDYLTFDTARQMLTSDFSRATGAYMSTDSSYYGNGWWRLRSPSNNYSNSARLVNDDGNANYIGDVNYDPHGVVPALNLTLS